MTRSRSGDDLADRRSWSRRPASARCSGPAMRAVTALERSTCAIRQGEFVSLIGPSGCGKSTLLRLIGDLTPPTTRDDRRSTASRPRRARLDRDYGMVFQAPVLMDWRTVAKNIELPLEIMGYPADERAPPGGRPAQARRARGVRRPPSLAALGRHAAARRHRPGPVVRPEAAAHGRAVRGARRDDPRADERRADEHLAADRDDDRVRDPQHPRGGLPVDPRRRHVRAARAGSRRSSTSICPPSGRSRPARSERYFELVTRVREALRQDEPPDATTPSGSREAERDPRRGPRREASTAAREWLPAVVVFVGVLVALGGRLARPRRPVVPDPATDASSASSSSSEWPTLVEGHRCSPATEAVVGLVVGVASGRWRASRRRAGRPPGRSLLPVAIGASTIPIIAFAPITLNWFGSESLLPRITIVAVMVLFPVMVNTDPRPDERRSGRARADVVVRRARSPDADQAARSRTRCRTGSRRSGSRRR